MDTPSNNLLSNIASILQSMAPDSSVNIPIDRTSLYFDDFIESNLGGLTAVGAGTGNSTQYGTYGMDNVENAIGISESDTGTTASGRRTVSSAGLNTLTTGTFKLYFSVRMSLHQLSTTADSFTSTLGFINNSGVGDHTSGAYFSYTHSANGGRWQAVTSNGTGGPSKTYVDTGVSANLSYHIFEIYIPQNTEYAEFFIDGVSTAKIKTTVPPLSTAANTTFGYGWKIEKSTGLNPVYQSADWYYFQQTRIYPR